MISPKYTLAGLAAVAASMLVQNAPAHAISFIIDSGIAGPNGETDQGAYSQYSGMKGFQTVDFNNGFAPTEGFATYSFSNPNGRSQVVNPGDREMKWAPDGANNEVNVSPYLQVFSGSTVTIDLAESLNYFGINWGSASGGNVFSFYNGGEEVGSFTVNDMWNAGFAFTGSQSRQGTGYVSFYSESGEDTFDQIVISQVRGGGFETDNHSFHVGSGAFSPENPTADVPEPAAALGLLTVGGIFLRRRLTQETV